MDPLMFDSLYTEELYHVAEPVTVVLDQPWADVTLPERELLSKIVGAIRVGIDKVRIVYQPKLDLSAWAARPEKVIAFVGPVTGLELHQAIAAQGTTVVLTYPLRHLLSDDPSRKKLWETLRPVFVG